MDDQMLIQQTIIVDQNEINPNRSVEKKSFFNELGQPVSVVNAVVEDYTYPTLLTGWDAFPDIGMGTPSGPRFFKDPSGIVWVDIYVDSNENYLTGVPGTPIFTLPEGYRPDATVIRFASWSDLTHQPESCMITIFANGNVCAPVPPLGPDMIGTNPYLLGGFSFRVID